MPYRFRIRPQKKGRNTEAKLEFPTYYLGLSRLYPIGESKKVEINPVNISHEDIEYFRQYNREILDLNDGIDALSDILVSENSRKLGLGIENAIYGPLGNSNGQDNLNQILAALLSFRKLKDKLGERFHGGMLLIDELDASLHPSAQNNLVDLLFKEAKEIGIQIIFTTHSLSMLKHFVSLQRRNGMNLACLSYVTRGRGEIEVKHNPSYKWIENELMVTLGTRHNSEAKVKFLVEDKVARWFIESAFDYFEVSPQIKFVDIDIDWFNILRLISSDPSYFSEYISILDADVSDDSIVSKVKRNGFNLNYAGGKKINLKTIFKFPNLLPTKNQDPEFVSKEDFRPYMELEIWEYLVGLDEDDKLYKDPRSEDIALFKRTLLNEGPRQYHKGKVEDKIKKWFKENDTIVNIAVEFFIADNEELVKKFINSILTKYNIVAENDPQIKKIELI